MGYIIIQDILAQSKLQKYEGSYLDTSGEG